MSWLSFVTGPLSWDDAEPDIMPVVLPEPVDGEALGVVDIVLPVVPVVPWVEDWANANPLPHSRNAADSAVAARFLLIIFSK